MKYFSKNKKWMAYLILLTFLFTSIMPSNLATGDSVVYAATDGTVAGQIEVQPTEQVINGTDGNPEVKIQKTVAAGDSENEFKVTLQVKTPENLTEIPSSADAAVVLVIDKSGSMDDKTLDCGLEEHSHHNCKTNCNHYYSYSHNDSCYTCGKIAHSHGNSCYELECTRNHYHSNECYVTRMDAARIAAKAFVQTFSDSKTGANDKRLVSIVEFSSNAASRDLDVNNSSTAKIYWQDVATTSGKNAIDNALAVYSNDSGDGGTNIAGGLQLAANIINHSKGTNGVLEDIDNVTVILLTDGCPTFHINGNTMPTNALNSITGVQGGGSVANAEDQSDAIAAANNVKAVSSLKVIALDTGSASYEVNGNWQSLDTATWLQSNIGSTYRANNVSTLVDSFEQIKTLILLGTQAWQVTDPMAPNIVYTGSMTGGNANDTSKTGDTYVYNAATVSEPETLLWKLKDSYPDGEEMVGETKWYVYTLEYPIRLDNTASGFSFDTAVATNNPTVLDYFMFSKVVETDTVTAGSMKKANFDVPKVEGYAGDVTFKKTDALTGKGLNGAVFTLTLKDCHTSHAGAYTATATYGADGTITFSNVPSGHQYTLKETSAPTGYVLPANEADRSWDVTVAFGNASIKDGNTSIDTIPNTPETVTVEGTKTWDDNNNQDGLRPDSITVNLLKNGTKIDSQTVNAPILERVFSFDAETWTYKWTDLPKYENGAEIEYTITEEAVEGYTPTIDGYNITNKHVPEKTEVSGTKIWEDADNQDGKRPTSITVNLLADGEPVASKTVTANDGWKYNFTGLDKFKDGEEIVYAVAEEAVAGYTPEVKDYNITNIHTPETTEATVVKVWDDADNQDRKRPESLEVTLSNGTKVTLNEGNKWTATVEDLPVYEDGQKITYTWTEDTTALPEGYELTDTSVNGTVTTLTNSYEPELTDVTVKKVWDDADNQDGIRPESLAVTLSNGQSVTLNAENQWTATVENLPVYADGEEIEYTWTEGTLPEGYALTGTSVNGTITTITNTHVPELTEATVVKVWDEANNQDGKRPEELEVTLSDGTEVTLSAANNWTATVSDLPKYADGEEIEYTWTEGTLPEGYALTDTSVDGTITTLTNSYEPEVTSATVVKVWDDANNQDGIRPESLAVTLSNGQSVTLNAANNWTATVENLPKYEAGQLISYAWTEGDMPEGYALTDTSVEGTVTTLTNSYEPEVTSATVTKVWNDGDDQDGIRPDELKVALSNGIEVTLNETNGWTATVENLPVYANGKVIEYTWAEGDMPDGYTLTDTSVNGTITTITNTHTPEVTSKTVKKVWDDANNQDGKRPTELKVALSNGTEVTLNAANNWTATIDNLPKYEDGELIIYTWTEAKVDGYVQSGLSTASDLTTFTNTHVPETTEATVVKVWDDANDQDGKRPESLEVTLSNGTSVTLNDANNWTATIKDLPVYEAGKVIEYTWTEETVTGYELTDTNVNGTVTTLTNTHIPEVTEATVVKVWDDAQNQDGIRPASLVVTLSNGQSVTLNEGNEWTATINNLPVYANGEEIEYSWTEANVEGYELTDTSVDGTVTTLTNTHTPETTEATVVKVWEDADNQDGKRPVNLKVTLSDGTKVTLNEANDWTATVKDLPKYNAGVEIKYTWTEADVDGYTLVSNVTVGKVTTITNKHVPEVTEASVVKVWDDAQNQDGIRPASLVVTLSNGQSVTLNEGNEWTATINNLPVYANGERIEYSWTEANVEGYELTGEVTDGTVTTLTNTHIPETTEATVVKVWEDADNQDGKRPASLVATLSNGETVTLSEANNWTATIDNLPKYENGELIIYTWTEASVEGYVQTGLSTASGITTFKNTHKIATTEVAGSKTWNDNNNQDGVRPASITVNLLADGTEIDEATVTAENGWAWSFAELPKYKDGGKEIKYTITEDDVAYYTAEVDGYNITNTHTPATTSIYGEKIWDDNDNAAQARPEYITVELFADGVKVDSTSATAVDWAYAFDNLPVYKNGGETIVYQVVEVAVKDYTTAYTKAVNKNDIQVNIINTYAVEDPEFVTIKGTKVWNDNDNAAGKRPASITVNLFNGGAEPVATTTASLTTDWTYAFTDLPKADENGKAYDYTVTETPVPEYRSVVVETTAGFDIYNSLINGEAGQILVSKLVTGDKAPEDGVYKFVLNINAVKSEWTSLKVYELLQLEKAYEAAVKAYNDAKEAWNDAVDVFKGNAKELNTTGSVLQFAMAEEATSPSGYEYLMIDEDARMTTTSSSYYFDGCEKADEEIVNPVVEAIAKLARDFNCAGGAFLEALLGEVAVPSLGFMRDDVQDLLDEADRLFEAEALMEATSASVYEFKNSPDVTTASAVTLIITDADGNETRVTTSGAYQFEFELTGVKSLAELENEMFKFRFEAEDGTVITYSIEEVDWVKEGYEGTSIKLNGEVVASGVETDDYVLTTGSVYDFVFINDYEDETGGGYTPPPYTPPYVPPTIITPPEIEIEDPEVPLDEPPVIEPGIEIEEPEVPLGDAPRTGDATNAVPFMALMLFAMAGLAVTRRRFN